MLCVWSLHVLSKLVEGWAIRQKYYITIFYFLWCDEDVTCLGQHMVMILSETLTHGLTNMYTYCSLQFCGECTHH